MSLLPRRVSSPCRLTAGSTLLLSCLATSLAAQESLYQHVGKPTASYSRAFAGGGDFDGDGYADYVAGLGGGSGGQLAAYSGATAQALRVQRNHAVDDTLGACLAVLGDLDGDGAADYMAGAPTDDRNGAGAGAAHVFSGRTHARLVSYYGSAAGDGLGACAALGDLDGDGVGDFAFAAPGHDFAAYDAGAVYVMSGRTRLVVRSHHGGSGQQLTLRGVESPVRAIEEDFTTNVRIDVMRSAFGVFGRPARVGGTGMHGDFDHRMGTDLGGGVFEFDLERDTRGGVRGFAVPAANTLSGREEFVVDGMFQFATLQVPAGITVRFRGTKPVRFLVRGQCQLDGVLDVSAVDSIPLHLGFYINGQEPVRPGAGGGRGGRGANASTGTAPSDGGNGQDVQVAASHAYAGSAVGTGGRGSTQFPTSNATVTHSYSGVVCTQMTAGGAGGGNGAVGAAGNVLRTPNNVPGDAGPPSIAGTTFQFFPLPNPYAAFVHFAAGGAGGGGGGSNIYSHTVGRTFQWRSGAAGGGGGGVLAIRAGGALLGGANGQVLARGGEAYRDYQSVVQGSPAPGGGGAGGSILLQSPARITLGGLVDASGGRGGFIAPGIGQPLLDLSADGGDGGAGFLRVESAGSVTIGTAVPPLGTPNRGPLLELDPQAGQQSTWYTTGLALTPRYLRYEILADVNQVPTRFSDDPAFGQPALFGDPGAALWFKLQGADVDQGLLPAPGTVRPWRDRAADLTLDRATGFRFVILGNGALVAIRSVRVILEQ